MAILTEQRYEEYIRLLKAWVEAEKGLEGQAPPDGEAAHRAREAYAAVQSFRSAHGLGTEPAMAEAQAAQMVEERR